MAYNELDIEYLDVQILKTEINNLVKKPFQEGDIFELKHSTKVNHLYNLEKQLIRVIIELSILVFVDGKEVKAGAKFEIDNYFHYKSLTDYAHEENGRILIETKFADTVKGLAYSTARGIIYSKLSGTFLEGTLLPTQMSTSI
ncbi:MAG TPA: hypothetical protein VIH86_03280 [Puia sp.]